MRTAIVLALAATALLGGCKREPSFEERYDTANKTIVERAKQIDAQLAGHKGPAPSDHAEDPAAVH